MIKVVAGFKRKPDLTMREFSEYYFDHHAALFRRETPADVAAGIPHYVQNHAVELGGAGARPPFDCVTEIGFVDLESLRRWNAWYFGPDGQVLHDDEDHFMDKSSRVIVVTEERVPPR